MKIKTIIKNYKNSLFTVNKEPLTSLSKFFLGVFVLFSFIILSISLSQQGRTIESPSKKFGYECLNFVDNQNDLNDITYFRYQKHILSFGSNKSCKTLSYLYANARKDLSPYINLIDEQNRVKSNLMSKIRVLKSEYSNTLLEKIANQAKQKSILHSSADNVKSKIESLNHQISKLNKAIKTNKTKAKQKASYKKFISYLKQNASAIKNKYDKYTRYYSLRVLGSKYLFLIPLFFVVFLLYNFAIKREKYILSHLLINLLNVVGLFILFYLLEFIYNIIPHTIFQKLFELLYKLNIIAFANYIFIALFVIIFGLIIKFIQNRAKKQKEQKSSIYKKTYIKQGKCPNCGAYKDKSYNFCPHCGENLYTTCSSCGKKRISESSFCQECGSK